MIKNLDRQLLSEQGFQLVDGLINHNTLAKIKKELEKFSFQQNKGGIRNVEKKISLLKDFIECDEFISHVNYLLNKNSKVVRAILFNKTLENNWLVSWHQDKTVSVSEKFEADGWENWSIKDGVHHVHPPVEVLNRMLTFRIHLDDTNSENGCLKIIPKSHLKGILKQEQIDQYLDQSTDFSCNAKAGSTLVMRPLLLHSSSKVISDQPRRILHIEFSDYQLPDGVSWA